MVESIMLIMDTESENRGEYPTASQLLQDWAARLRAWLRRQPEPETEGAEPTEEQDGGTGLIL
jgi:hypothetical protein